MVNRSRGADFCETASLVQFESVKEIVNRTVLEVRKCQSEGISISWEPLIPGKAGSIGVNDFQRPQGGLAASKLDLKAIPVRMFAYHRIRQLKIQILLGRIK